jgi:hypothetical protein
MEEPSVLDYLKSRIIFWRKSTIEFPDSRPEEWEVSGESVLSEEPVEIGRHSGLAGIFAGVWSLLPLAVVLIGIIAQSSLESESRSPYLAVILYTAAAALMGWQMFGGKWKLPFAADEKNGRKLAVSFRRAPGIVTLVLIPISFLLFDGNRFTEINLLTWLALLGFFMAAFLEEPGQTFQKILSAVKGFIKQPVLNIRITPWAALLLVSAGLVLFFRLNALNEVPGEMFSDHAEKLLDVSGVLNGNHLIFFPRNTGREAVQMYLTAAVAILGGTGLSFMSLKIGTALAGLLALPFVYLIGKRVGGRWVGLFSLLLCGIAYWPNLISRIGLRFPLYPLFVAPAIYFLIRGFQDKSCNSLILAGLMIGLGMHGYSPFRIVPLLIVIAFLLYFAFSKSDEEKSKLGINFLVLALAALIVFLPLMKFMVEDPVNFGERAFSRLGSVERPLPGPLWEIFFTNSWKALVMFFWDNGNIWVHSVVGRPALDVVTAVFYFMGSINILARFIRGKNWLDLFLLLSVPILILPSVLSLAFPEENPSLNRTAGAIIPVFVIAAFGLVSFVQSLAARIRGKRGLAVAVVATILLMGMSINQNYSLVFKQFNRQFIAGALNTSEIGAVIKAFEEMGGSPDTAYVVPYPYWVDTRLVGINAGYPLRDFAMFPENFTTTLGDARMKLFIFNPEDLANLEIIKEMYPRGILSTYSARVQGKDFLMYLIPPG